MTVPGFPCKRFFLCHPELDSGSTVKQHEKALLWSLVGRYKTCPYRDF
jgi:hypothetical protein